jgi:hypothetical protein
MRNYPNHLFSTAFALLVAFFAALSALVYTTPAHAQGGDFVQRQIACDTPAYVSAGRDPIPGVVLTAGSSWWMRNTPTQGDDGLDYFETFIGGAQNGFVSAACVAGYTQVNGTTATGNVSGSVRGRGARSYNGRVITCDVQAHSKPGNDPIPGAVIRSGSTWWVINTPVKGSDGQDWNEIFLGGTQNGFIPADCLGAYTETSGATNYGQITPDRPAGRDYVMYTIVCNTPAYMSPGGQVVNGVTLNTGSTWWIIETPVSSTDGQQWNEVFINANSNAFIPASCVGTIVSVNGEQARTTVRR